MVYGWPLVRVCFETKFDQVFTLGGDIGPLGLGELVLARPGKYIGFEKKSFYKNLNFDKDEFFGAPDPLFHPRGNWLTMMRVKWRVSANTEMKNFYFSRCHESQQPDNRPNTH